MEPNLSFLVGHLIFVGRVSKSTLAQIFIQIIWMFTIMDKHNIQII